MKQLVFLLFIGLLLPAKKYSQSDALGHEEWEYILEDSGDVLQIALPVTAGVVSLLKKDYQGTKKFVYAYATTFAVTYSLKYITEKKRPEGRKQYDSFPSGHTSSAFSGASFLQRRYGWGYGIPAYLLAAAVGVSRLEAPDGYHDTWDVIGGGAIGIASTYLFTKPYKKPKIEVVFGSNTNYKVLTIVYTF